MCWRLAGLVPAPAPAHAHASSARTSMRQAQHYCHTHTEGWAQRVMPPARQRGGGGRGSRSDSHHLLAQHLHGTPREEQAGLNFQERLSGARRHRVCGLPARAHATPHAHARARARVCVRLACSPSLPDLMRLESVSTMTPNTIMPAVSSRMDVTW